MKHKSESHTLATLPVARSKEEAKQFYDRISRFYGYLSATFERKYAEMALEQLTVREGETVLEIGFGAGHSLKQIAQSVGQTGKVYGIDISSGMLEATRRRLEKARLINRIELHCGDVTNLPYGDNTFDATFMSFTLELFDTPEIPKILEEVKRVLKAAGRLGVVSMSKEDGEFMLLRLYEWAHKKWPRYIDCRPIYVKPSLISAGYKIQRSQKARLMGLPLEIVVAVNTT